MISVIVSVYKTEPWLRQCVDSILGQTFRDIELILVDDGSPDGSPALCDQYAAADPRVRVIHKQNGGIASAIAAGLRIAGGEYVGIVDSDDWIDPDYFQELYRCAAEQHADIVEGRIVNEFAADGRVTVLGAKRSRTTVYAGGEDIRRLTGLYMTSFLYDGMPDRPDRPLSYSKCDKLFRREILFGALALYDESLSLGEDVILIAAALPGCQRVVTLKTSALYHRRVLAGSVSHQAGSDQMARICAAHAALMRVVREKDLDAGAAGAFIGSMVHARIYRTAGLPDVRAGEKCRRMKAMLRQAPAGTLEAFVRARGSLFLRTFYGLLRGGLALPCVWAVTLHAAVSGAQAKT